MAAQHFFHEFLTNLRGSIASLLRLTHSSTPRGAYVRIATVAHCAVAPLIQYHARMRRYSEYLPSFLRRQQPHIAGLQLRVYDQEWNEMEPNGTELKHLPLLITPEQQPTPPAKATRGQTGPCPARTARVGGGPNKARVASYSAPPPGVNEANQGQMGPGLNTPLLMHS